jgi:hypothetical protein
MEHWWNDTDRQNPWYSEKNLSQCHYGQPPVNLHGDTPLATYLSRGTDVFCAMDYFYSHVANTVIEQPTG